jgi:hypothetical protein
VVSKTVQSLTVPVAPVPDDPVGSTFAVPVIFSNDDSEPITANVTEATTPELGMIGSLSSFEKITGTAKVEPTGSSGTGATGTVKLWTVLDTTSDGTETWTTGHAN